MNQRPSLVWQMLGLWFGPSDAWRQVSRNRGTPRQTRHIPAEVGHPRRDEVREARCERGVLEFQHFDERTAAGVEQDIGTADEAQQVLARSGLAQVEHHGFLVAVVVPEEERALEPRLV